MVFDRMDDEVTEGIQEVGCPEPVEGRFFVYLLTCGDGSIYCGSAKDIRKRLKEHISGEGAIWTKVRQPIKLCYYEMYNSLVTARRRERQIKGWSREKKDNLMNGTWKKVD